MSSFEDKKHNELKASINTLFFINLSLKVWKRISLRRNTTFKERFTVLESSPENTPPATSDYLPLLLNVLYKRENYSFNTIVYGLEKSSLKTDKISEDTKLFSYTIYTFSLLLPSSIKVFRLSRMNVLGHYNFFFYL